MAALNAYLKTSYFVTRYRDVLYVQLKDGYEMNESTGNGGIFYFPFGAIVCWGVSEERETRMLHEIQPFETQRTDIVEDDDFSYSYGRVAAVQDDEIILPDEEVLTKLAFSHAIAQSVKLGVFELTIQRTIHLTKELPELLARQGEIKLSRRDIRRMMGRLFIDRSSINLHQELLDIPEFFWEHDDLEPYYELMSHYLDCESRVSVLNQRLVILQELFDMLAAELNHQHSSRLEWIIITLILIEVFLHLFHDVLSIF